MEEQWKKINDYPNYSVSSTGKVRNDVTGKILKSGDRVGYNLIVLCKNGIPKSYRVHRIVAKHYIPNPENKEEVNHINGIKNDNRVENLEWSTRKDNMEHAIETGLMNQDGEDNHCSKLTKEDVLYIRKNYIKGHHEFSQAALSRKFNVSHSNISKIILQKTWTHI